MKIYPSQIGNDWDIININCRPVQNSSSTLANTNSYDGVSHIDDEDGTEVAAGGVL